MRNKIDKRILEKGFLLTSHRGTFKANIIENTIGSFNAAILEGGDIVEIDLIKSKDGVLYLFHDGNEKRVFQKDINIFDLTSSEIDELTIYNHITKATDEKLLKLDDYFKYLQGLDFEFFVNIDRSWDYLDILLPKISEYGLNDRMVIKGPVGDYLSEYKEDLKDFMFLAIVRTKEDVSKAIELLDGNVLGFEIIVLDGNNSLDDKDYLKELQEQSYLIWINSITLDYKTPLFYKLDDDNVIKSLDTEAWDKIMEYNPQIIQTDWIGIWDRYREKRSK